MRTLQIFLIALFAVIFASLVFASEPSEIFALNTETAHEVSYTTTTSDIQITKPVPVDGYPALTARIAYPEFARTSKIDGNLLVKAYIDENGQVQSISKVKGNDENPALRTLFGVFYWIQNGNRQPLTERLCLPILKSHFGFNFPINLVNNPDLKARFNEPGFSFNFPQFFNIIHYRYILRLSRVESL